MQLATWDRIFTQKMFNRCNYFLKQNSAYRMYRIFAHQPIKKWHACRLVHSIMIFLPKVYRTSKTYLLYWPLLKLSSSRLYFSQVSSNEILSTICCFQRRHCRRALILEPKSRLALIFSSIQTTWTTWRSSWTMPMSLRRWYSSSFVCKNYRQHVLG